MGLLHSTPPPGSRRPGRSMLLLMFLSHNIAQGAFATSPTSPPGIILAPVKSRRVVDQQRLLGRRGGRDPRDKVDKRPVVGGLFLHVGMRPVGPPDDTLGELLDQAIVIRSGQVAFTQKFRCCAIRRWKRWFSG